MSYPVAHLTTLLVEVPLLVLVSWALGWLRQVGLPRTLLAGLLTNLTHPVLWWLTSGRSFSTVLVAELAVVVVEGLALVVMMRRWGVAGAPGGPGC